MPRWRSQVCFDGLNLTDVLKRHLLIFSRRQHPDLKRKVTHLSPESVLFISPSRSKSNSIQLNAPAQLMLLLACIFALTPNENSRYSLTTVTSSKLLLYYKISICCSDYRYDDFIKLVSQINNLRFNKICNSHLHEKYEPRTIVTLTFTIIWSPF